MIVPLLHEMLAYLILVVAYTRVNDATLMFCPCLPSCCMIAEFYEIVRSFSATIVQVVLC